MTVMVTVVTVMLTVTVVTVTVNLGGYLKNSDTNDEYTEFTCF